MTQLEVFIVLGVAVVVALGAWIIWTIEDRK